MQTKVSDLKDPATVDKTVGRLEVSVRQNLAVVQISHTLHTREHSAHFYSASALLAMRPLYYLVAASVRLSVCPSVCPSDTFRCFVEKNEATIMRFSLSGSKYRQEIRRGSPLARELK